MNKHIIRDMTRPLSQRDRYELRKSVIQFLQEDTHSTEQFHIALVLRNLEEQMDVIRTAYNDYMYLKNYQDEIQLY